MQVNTQPADPPCLFLSKPSTGAIRGPPRNVSRVSRLLRSPSDMPPPIGRRSFVRVLVGGVLALPRAPSARAIARPPTIRFLRCGAQPRGFIEAFEQGLRELGHLPHRNIHLEYRFPDDDSQLAAAAADLLGLDLSVVV